MEDGELIERAAGGDVGAFEVLVARHQALALRVAYGIAGPDAEDVVQEAFVKAFRALPRFRPGAAFRPWVLRIVANEARNVRRRGARQEQLRVRAERQPVPSPPSPEAAAEADDDRRRLAAAVSTLSVQDREVIAPVSYTHLTLPTNREV